MAVTVPSAFSTQTSQMARARGVSSTTSLTATWAETESPPQIRNDWWVRPRAVSPGSSPYQLLPTRYRQVGWFQHERSEAAEP
jgi:hypothetical protein